MENERTVIGDPSAPESQTRETRLAAIAHLEKELAKLPEDERQVFWQEVEVQLIRLHATTVGRMIMSPKESIFQTRKCAQTGSSLRKRAKQCGCSPPAIASTVEDTRAAIAFTLQQKPFSDSGINSLQLTPSELKTLHRLDKVEQKSRRIKSAIRTSSASQALSRVPHLQTVFETYQRYMTVVPLLKNGCPDLDPHAISTLNGSISAFLLTDQPPVRVKALARKILFSQWVENQESCVNNPAKAVARAAQAILALEPDHRTMRPDIVHAQRFLQAMAFADFVYLKDRLDPKTLREFFPQGDKTQWQNPTDIIPLYAIYEKLGYPSPTMKWFALQITEGQNYLAIAKQLGNNLRLCYQPSTKMGWVGAGVVFLERALTKQSYSNSNFLFLLKSTIADISKAREKIRQADRARIQA